MTTILVVEDEAIVAMDIAQRLKRAGYDVPAVAATGEVALRTLEELHPDLVLMDILLKGEKNGIETAREIKDQFEIPVIFLTGQADESTQEQIKNTGVGQARLRGTTQGERKPVPCSHRRGGGPHFFHGHAGHRDLLEQGCRKNLRMDSR